MKAGCGKTAGHGDSCTAGWLCDACEGKYKMHDALYAFAAKLEAEINPGSKYAGQRLHSLLDELSGEKS